MSGRQDGYWHRAFFAALAGTASPDCDADDVVWRAGRIADEAQKLLESRKNTPDPNQIGDVVVAQPGWTAVFAHVDEAPEIVVEPIAAWTVVRQEGDTYVNAYMRPLVRDGAGLGLSPFDDDDDALGPEVMAPGETLAAEAKALLLERATATFRARKKS